MPIDKVKLRNKAKTIVTIPEHYRLELEDSIPKGNETQRCFIWEDPENKDNKIEITLDLITGHLTRLDINREEIEDLKREEAKLVELEGDARAVADVFVAKHAPEPAEYTSVSIKKRGSRIEFVYREEVGGLQLPHTGCKLIMDTGLNVDRYRLEERTDRKACKPKWPAFIVDADTVKQHIQSNLKMVLTIVSLYPSIYEMNGTEPEYRLVYEPIQESRWIDAVTGLDLYSPEHYVMPPSHPIPHIDIVQQPSANNTLSWEHWLEINLEHYVLEKSTDDGQRIKSLYQLKEQEEDKPEKDPLSVDGYMERKWGDNLRHFRNFSIIVQIEKATGRLVGFNSIGRGKEGEPTLRRDQCWTKAEQFLRIVFPDYVQYLQLESNKVKSDEEPCEREFFYLPVYIDGIPVNHERLQSV